MGTAGRATVRQAPGDAMALDVTEHVPDVLIRYSSDGRVEWVSPSVESVFGYTPSELVGTRTRLSAPGERVSVSEEFGRAIASGVQVLRTRRRAQRADGTVIWTDTAARFVRDSQGRLASIVAVIRDVTGLVDPAGRPTDTACAVSHVVLAMADGDARRHLAWEFAGSGACVEVTDGGEDEVARLILECGPDVCLVDPHRLGDPRRGVRRLVGVAAGVPVLVVLDPHDDATFVGALSQGARGVVLRDRPQDVRRAVCAALAGEVAVPRPLTATLVAALRCHDLTQHGKGRLAQLTDRERLILDLVAQGLSTRQIAEELVVAPVTVRSHIAAAVHKLGVGTRAEAADVVRRLTLESD